ncbi:antibiotic biosynthesis monooxygenase family protein [Streptomyces sp. NPDC093225]|uniref:antibiotic biosynthesis monooxygenase family protein n=1 Tax=Streptomyces sp. NPDC093225 TaxID=3366034 RepID=UPI00380F044D
MTDDSTTWASGDWQVTEGDVDEFVARWRAFLEWTKADNAGFGHARLLRDLNRPGHFVSFSAWRDPAAMKDWQSRPEFAEHVGACRALCEDMTSSGYELAVAV